MGDGLSCSQKVLITATLLPSKYLHQAREGYWVTGNHMRLQPVPAKKDREMDSTFRMLVLRTSSA